MVTADELVKEQSERNIKRRKYFKKVYNLGIFAPTTTPTLKLWQES